MLPPFSTTLEPPASLPIAPRPNRRDSYSVRGYQSKEDPDAKHERSRGCHESRVTFRLGYAAQQQRRLGNAARKGSI